MSKAMGVLTKIVRIAATQPRLYRREAQTRWSKSCVLTYKDSIALLTPFINVLKWESEVCLKKHLHAGALDFLLISPLAIHLK